MAEKEDFGIGPINATEKEEEQQVLSSPSGNSSTAEERKKKKEDQTRPVMNGSFLFPSQLDCYPIGFLSDFYTVLMSIPFIVDDLVT